jgi:hypothetical protein
LENTSVAKLQKIETANRLNPDEEQTRHPGMFGQRLAAQHEPEAKKTEFKEAVDEPHEQAAREAGDEPGVERTGEQHEHEDGQDELLEFFLADLRRHLLAHRTEDIVSAEHAEEPGTGPEDHGIPSPMPNVRQRVAPFHVVRKASADWWRPPP